MYTDIELMKVLESVEKEFNAHLAKAEEESKPSLAKAEDKPFPPKDKKPEDKEEEKKLEGEAKEGDKKPEEKKPEDEQAAGEQKPAEGQPDEQKPADGQPAVGGEDHGYDNEDMEHMHKMYMSMSKSELKLHHDSVRKALDSQGMQKMGADCGPGMAKSETVTTIEVKVPEISAETTLLKSELESEKSKTAELQKKVDLATEFMAKLAAKKSAPQGKAITSLEVIAKSEDNKEEKTFTKSEVTSILAKKAEDPSLSKSDREAINDYYLGSKDIKIVRHLLA